MSNLYIHNTCKQLTSYTAFFRFFIWLFFAIRLNQTEISKFGALVMVFSIHATKYMYRSSRLTPSI